jgi:co-chaperonin GroES (HSP10)
MAKLTPVAKQVLVRVEPEKEQTESGLFIPTQEKRTNFGTIESVGSLIKEVKAGQQIYFKTYAPEELYENDEIYLIVPEEDILAIYEQD